MKLHLRLDDDYIDVDQVFGPLPHFRDSFESFFLQKSIDLLFGGTTPTDQAITPFKYIVN